MNDEKQYEMSFVRHVKYIWISLMFFLIAPGIYLFSVIQGNDNSSFQLILIIWTVLGLFYFIGFKLHLGYYRNDKNKKLVVRALSVIVKNKTEIYSFNKNDILSITNHYSGLNNMTPWNGYEFSVLKLKNGKEFIITCLLLDLQTIIATFPNSLIIKNFHFIATLNKNYCRQYIGISLVCK